MSLLQVLNFKAPTKNMKKFKEVPLYFLSHNDATLNIVIHTLSSVKSKFNSLMFKEITDSEVGFRILNSKGFNSFGLKNMVDVVMCDIKNEVIETFTSFKPQKMSKQYEECKSIYIFPVDYLKMRNIQIGDILKTEKIPAY